MGQISKDDSTAHLRQLLRDNPRLFRDHPELLDELELGGEAGDRVVSLEQARTRRLERKVGELEEELQGLVATARENDRLARHLHRLTMDLLDCGDGDEVAHTLLEGVRQNFRVEAVGLRVAREWFSDRLDPRFLAPQLWVQNCFVSGGTVVLGGPADSETVQSLYGATESPVHSQALVALREGPQVFGVLALGSADEGRYREGMGTAYLEQMAEVAGAMLTRCRS